MHTLLRNVFLPFQPSNRLCTLFVLHMVLGIEDAAVNRVLTLMEFSFYQGRQTLRGKNVVMNAVKKNKTEAE